MADSPDLPPSDSGRGSPGPGTPGPGETGPGKAPLTPAPQRSQATGLRALGTLLVRLMILGTGVGLGWLTGILVAQVVPARNPEPPLVEMALRHSSQTLRKLRQLPQWWQGGSTVGLAPADPAPGLTSLPPYPVNPTAAPLPTLTEGDRQRLQTDLTGLQGDLASLNNRLEVLESRLGASPGGTLEDRLQRLDQRLDSGSTGNSSAAPAASAPPPGGERPALVPYQEPRFTRVSDRIVLPSALLFEPGSSVLTTPGQQLLDSIAPDLSRYGPATLLVGSHTDTSAVPADIASQLTLQQALAVQQYLAPQLGAEGTRWVALGYGPTRPITPGLTATDRQRNQRVEIGLVPGS